MGKSFSQACENNKRPILNVLSQYLISNERVLELGSGTGQHARYFADNFPHVLWQTSDVQENHLGIECWIHNSKYNNIYAPIPLDINDKHLWPTKRYDAIFTANTMHIMSWQEVQCMFELVAACLIENGTFFSYGPYNDKGRFTSTSNQAFDAYLRNKNAKMGIRDLSDIVALAKQNKLRLKKVNAMPANNMLLIFDYLPQLKDE